MSFQNIKIMKPTNFSKYITDYISRYLPGERGASTNTITAYRDTFVLLISFLESVKRTRVEKLTLEKITKETIVEFLKRLQEKRQCSNSTRNARLAAIRSFYTYLQGESIGTSVRVSENIASQGQEPAKRDYDIHDRGWYKIVT
jgi:integrase/recombinase XerD